MLWWTVPERSISAKMTGACHIAARLSAMLEQSIDSSSQICNSRWVKETPHSVAEATSCSAVIRAAAEQAGSRRFIKYIIALMVFLQIRVVAEQWDSSGRLLFTGICISERIVS